MRQRGAIRRSSGRNWLARQEVKAWAMNVGRHCGKRASAPNAADARHRMPASRARQGSCEMAGAGGSSRQSGSLPRRVIGSFRHRCRWAAARIRIATGVKASDFERESGPQQRTPWLGLLLWALACAGLCVSLLMQPDDLDREPRVAAGKPVEVQPVTTVPAPGVTRQLNNRRLLAIEYYRRVD